MDSKTNTNADSNQSKTSDKELKELKDIIGQSKSSKKLKYIK